MPSGSQLSAISIPGTAGGIRCAYAMGREFGSSSSHGSRLARAINTISSVPRARSCRGNRTPWRAKPKRRRDSFDCRPARYYRWRDAEWMQRRGHRQATNAPISIYEVHLPSWLNSGQTRYEDDPVGCRCRAVDPLSRQNGFHACRASSDCRISVRRIVGISASRPVRAERPVRITARSRALHR